MTPQTPPTRCSRRRTPGKGRSLTRNHRVTMSDGISLSVRDWGSPAAGHTVVLLHGFCSNKESWNIQMTQLILRWTNNIRIISYDHRGHGDSGSAPMHTYRIDRLADDLAELLVALGVTGPLTLAGHSMGGMTALAYLRRPASKRPVEPQSLVLVATAAGNLGSRGLGRLLSTPATNMLYHLVHRMPRAGTDGVVQFLARPVCAALTRHGGYGEATPKSSVAMSVAAMRATPSTTKSASCVLLKSTTALNPELYHGQDNHHQWRSRQAHAGVARPRAGQRYPRVDAHPPAHRGAHAIARNPACRHRSHQLHHRRWRTGSRGRKPGQPVGTGRYRRSGPRLPPFRSYRPRRVRDAGKDARRRLPCRALRFVT